MTFQQAEQAVREGRLYVRGINRREQITRQRVLKVVEPPDEQGRVMVFTAVSPYSANLDELEERKR